MNKALREKLKKFKPVFGNPAHIRLAQILDNLQKRESSDPKEREDVDDELTMEEKNIEFLMKQ